MAGTNPFRSWLAEGFRPPQLIDSNGQPPTLTPGGLLGPLTYFDRRDPWPSLMADMATTKNRRLMLYGSFGSQFLFTERDTHIGIFGPGRTQKTSGVLIPLVMAHFGPTVTCSVRRDIARATSIFRARLGTIWHLDVNGEGTEPGMVPLRLSPLTKDYSVAKKRARSMLYAVELGQSGAKNAGYFAGMGAKYAGPVLLAGGLGALSMEWAKDILISQDPDMYLAAVDVLQQFPDDGGALSAIKDLGGLSNMSSTHGSMTDVLATIARAFDVFNDPKVLAVCENPNFDPDAFVAGRPEVRNYSLETDFDVDNPMLNPGRYGVYDTIHITADAESAEATAPIIVMLLQSLYNAAARQRERDDVARTRSPSMLWALDEMASMAPWDALPKLMQTAGGSGVLIAGVCGDYSQMQAKWGPEDTGSFLTNMRTKVYFPGIDDELTPKAVVASVGDDWIEVQSNSEQAGQGAGGPTSGHSTSYEKRFMEVLNTAMIRRGHPGDRSAMLVTDIRFPLGHAWAHPHPYYSAVPWPEMVIATLAHIRDQWGPDDPRAVLPVPVLDLDDEGKGPGHELFERRDSAQAQWILDWYAFHTAWRADVLAAQRAKAEAAAVVDASDDNESPEVAA